MRIFLSLALLITSVLSFTQNDAQGFWHDSPHVGSGLGEYYAFYDNMNFTYATSSMDCDQRLETISGIYTIEGDTIIMHIRKIEILIGGEIIADETSCYNGYYIEGGETMSFETSHEYLRKYHLEFFTFSEDDLTYDAVKINSRVFYKLSTDPSAYTND